MKAKTTKKAPVDDIDSFMKDIDSILKAKTKAKPAKSKYYEAQKRKADRLMAAFFRNLP